MKAVEKMGLLKMDFLGLTTLTVIDDCLKLINSNQGHHRRPRHHPSRRHRTFEQSSTARSPPASSSLNPAACATFFAATSPTPSSTSPRSTPSIALARCP